MKKETKKRIIGWIIGLILLGILFLMGWVGNIIIGGESLTPNEMLQNCQTKGWDGIKSDGWIYKCSNYTQAYKDARGLP